MSKEKKQKDRKGHPALDPLQALGAARMKAEQSAKEKTPQFPPGAPRKGLQTVEGTQPGTPAGSVSGPPQKLQTEAPKGELKPRIVRDGLIDEIIQWIRTQLTVLERAGSTPDTIAQVTSDLAAIQSYKQDLICLERSIELIDRADAEPLITAASRIRENIIDIYENLASGD